MAGNGRTVLWLKGIGVHIYLGIVSWVFTYGALFMVEWGLGILEHSGYLELYHYQVIMITMFHHHMLE